MVYNVQGLGMCGDGVQCTGSVGWCTMYRVWGCVVMVYNVQGLGMCGDGVQCTGSGDVW